MNSTPHVTDDEGPEDEKKGTLSASRITKHHEIWYESIRTYHAHNKESFEEKHSGCTPYTTHALDPCVAKRPKPFQAYLQETGQELKVTETNGQDTQVADWLFKKVDPREIVRGRVYGRVQAPC
jgi:hypothetical protein